MTDLDVSHLKDSLSSAIHKLEEIRDNITVDNAHLFKIDVSQKRDLEPIFFGMNAVGFSQKSGEILSITVENIAKLGKTLV